MNAEFVALSINADDVLKLLHELPAEVVSKRGGPVKNALMKAGRVIRDQARLNFAAAVAQPGKSGITQSTGFTEKNIIAKRKSMTSGQKGERVIVGVRYEDHPNANLRRRKSRSKGILRRRKITAKVLKANDIAFMMEYGTSKQAATPWLRPAFASKAQVAIKVAQDELVRQLNNIVKKLGKTR